MSLITLSEDLTNGTKVRVRILGKLRVSVFIELLCLIYYEKVVGQQRNNVNKDILL